MPAPEAVPPTPTKGARRLIVTPGEVGARTASAWLARTLPQAPDVARAAGSLVSDSRGLPGEPVMLVVHGCRVGWRVEVRLPGMGGGALLAAVELAA